MSAPNAIGEYKLLIINAQRPIDSLDPSYPSVVRSWPSILQVVRPSRLTIQLNIEGWHRENLPILIPADLGLEVTHADLTIIFGSPEIMLDDLAESTG